MLEHQADFVTISRGQIVIEAVHHYSFAVTQENLCSPLFFKHSNTLMTRTLSRCRHPARCPPDRLCDFRLPTPSPDSRIQVARREASLLHA